jgi:PAS domain S-box-containing protein
MLVLRGFVPTSLAIVIQNFVYPLAAVLYLGGTRSFLGLSDMSRGWYALPAVSALFNIFSVYYFDSATWRTVIVSLTFAVPHVVTATLIFRDYPKTKSLFSLVLGSEMVLASAVLMAWALWSFTISDFHLLMTTPVHASLFISLMVLQVIITVSFLMLNAERVNRDLLLAQDALKLSEEKYSKAFRSTPDAITISRMTDGRLVDVNEGFSLLTECPRDEALASSTVALDLWADPKDREKVVTALRDRKRVSDQEFRFRTRSGKILDCLYSAEIILIGDEVHILSVVRDITDRTRAEQEKASLIVKLQEALAEVKKLSGILPICSSCKKIRDDKGYWKQVERYIGEHSEAQFSHSICPDCIRKLYPEIADDVLAALEKREK